MNWGSKEWANEQLRFAIKVLSGKIVVSRPNGLLQVALIIKKDLLDNGFRWQARILSCHIHCFQREHKKEIVGLRRVLQ